MFLLQHLEVDSESGWIGRVSITHFQNHYRHTVKKSYQKHTNSLTCLLKLPCQFHTQIYLPSKSYINNLVVHSSLRRNRCLTQTGAAITWWWVTPLGTNTSITWSWWVNSLLTAVCVCNTHTHTHAFCAGSSRQGKTTAITSGEWEVVDILKVTEDSM